MDIVKKTDSEIADIMGDLVKEKVFVYIKETDRTQFVMTVVGALGDELEERADVFILVFERGFTSEFAEGVKMEIAKLRQETLDAWQAQNPTPDEPNPDNPIKARWLRVQLDATENTIEALQDFIIH